MPLRRPGRPSDDDQPSKPTRAREDDGYDDDEDDAPTPPKRGLRGARNDDDAVNKAFRAGTREGTGKDDDEDEDEKPSTVKTGWAAARKAKAESGTFAADLKWPETDKGEEPVLIRFLADEPITYQQHWIDSGLTSTNKKSFNCMGKKNGCPLCAIGDDAQPKWAFSVAVIDDEVEVKCLTAGIKLLGQLEALHNGKTTGPLTRLYYGASRTGTKAKTVYNLNSVKPRDLSEDWNLDLDEVEAELADAKPIDPKTFAPMTKAQLRAIANELTGADE